MPSVIKALGFWSSLAMASLSLSAFASQVTQIGDNSASVIVDQDLGAPWKEGDPVCVIHDEKEIGCGKVSKASDAVAIITLDFQDEDILEGDEVRSPGKKNKPKKELLKEELPNEERSASSEEVPQKSLVGNKLLKATAPPIAESEVAAPEESQEAAPNPLGETTEKAMTRTNEEEPSRVEPNDSAPTPEDRERFRKMSRIEIVQYHRNLIHSRASALSSDGITSYGATLIRKLDLTIGGLAYGESGGNSIWPQALVQIALTPRYSLHLSGSYYGFSVANFNSTTIGATIGATYYPSSLFDGVMGTFGGGLGVTSATSGNSSGSVISLHILGTVGYRWYVDEGFNIGLQAGGQFFSVPQMDGVTVGSATILLPVLMVDLGFCF